jgi:hypothetical protein
MNNTDYEFEAVGNDYTLTLSDLLHGSYNCTFEVSYILDGESLLYRSNYEFTVERIYTPLVFSGVSGKQSPIDTTATLTLKITPNDSKITSITVSENNKNLQISTNKYTVTTPALSVGAHSLKITVKYTTNGVSSSASKTLKLTIKAPPVDLEAENIRGIYDENNSMDFSSEFFPNDAENITATFYSIDRSYSAPVTIISEQNFYEGYVENIPVDNESPYTLFDIVFSYTLNGVEMQKTIKVLACHVSVARSFPGTFRPVIEYVEEYGGYYFQNKSSLEDFADLISLSRLEITIFDYMGIVPSRVVYSRDLSDISPQDINSISTLLQINDDEISEYVELRVSLYYTVEGYEFKTLTTFVTYYL